MYLWGRAIMRSLATHLLASRDLRSSVRDEDADELKREYGHLIGNFRRPRSIYSVLREIINEHNTGNHLSRYLEHPDWDDLSTRSPTCFGRARPCSSTLTLPTTPSTLRRSTGSAATRGCSCR